MIWPFTRSDDGAGVAAAGENGATAAFVFDPVEIREEFSSLSEWVAYAERSPITQTLIETVATRIRARGIYFTVANEQAPPDQVVVDGDNYRESITYNGTNSRHRAVLNEVLRCLGDRPHHLCRIYAAEALTPFAMLLRSRYMRFIGSEYTEDAALRELLYPIPVEDLLNLSLKSSAFHAAVVNDVFEHVPDIRRVLSELARILEPGGHLVSTFPFRANTDESLVKARLADGGIEYLMEPEYHGDPMSEKGALVFEIPGWDVLGYCREAGFSSARMVFVLSQTHGILAPHYGGVFVLVAQK